MQNDNSPDTTVLVVDDEPLIRSLVERTLKLSRYGVLLARDGEQALEISEAHSGQIHVLLTDLRMPETDGICLARKLRHARPDLRVILMSGYFDQPPTSRAGWTFIRKPFGPTALLETIRGALRKPNAPLDDLAEAKSWLG